MTRAAYPRAEYQRWLLRAASFGGLAFLAARQCQVNWQDLAEAVPKFGELFGLFLPPLWTAFPEMLEPAAVTLSLAILATPAGAALSLLFALAAARNVAPAPLRAFARFVVAAERGLPEVVTLLIVAAAIGMGFVPGIIALAVGSLGMLGKLLADALEEVDDRCMESVRAVGGSHFQAIRWGLLPEAWPRIAAAIIFRFEVNVRASIVVGALGAGGLGYEIHGALSHVEYDRAASAILTTLLLVFATERASVAVMRKLGQGRLQ